MYILVMTNEFPKETAVPFLNATLATALANEILICAEGS
jgi:hypothetical protein